MTILGIKHLAIAVSDCDAALAHYQRFLGVGLDAKPRDLVKGGSREAHFRFGDVEIQLCQSLTPDHRFAEFIEARFRATKLRPAPGLGAAIVELAGNLPYDVQRLAHEVWDDAQGGKAVGLDDLHETLKRLLGEHDAIFEATWQRLTLAQRASLRAAVLEEGLELLSADVRARYRLGGASTVQAALSALVREDILAREGARYVIVDSLFREWVARHTH